MYKCITVYIAGQVSKMPAQQAAAIFASKEQELIANGYTVINPVQLIELENNFRKSVGEPPLTDQHHRREIMAQCLYNLLVHADELHMLRGWQESDGARLERDVALKLGIPIVYH